MNPRANYFGHVDPLSHLTLSPTEVSARSIIYRFNGAMEERIAGSPSSEVGDATVTGDVAGPEIPNVETRELNRKKRELNATNHKPQEKMLICSTVKLNYCQGWYPNFGCYRQD